MLFNGILENRQLGHLATSPYESGWHYLSDATCPTLPHLCYALFIVSRITPSFVKTFADFEENLRYTLSVAPRLQQTYSLVLRRGLNKHIANNNNNNSSSSNNDNNSMSIINISITLLLYSFAILS